MEINSNHSSKDQDKTIEKTLNDSTKQVMDFYTNQLNVAAGFYKNIFDSFSIGNKDWTSNNPFSNAWFGNNSTKAFAMPFDGMSNNLTNPFLPFFNNLYNQIADYNAVMFSILSTGLKSNTNVFDTGKKYQDTFNTRIDTSKNILKTATEAYNKQLDFSIEANRKAVEEMNNQFNEMVKQNQTFWSDLIVSNQTPINTGEEIVKDSITPDIKKRTGVPASELLDHKV
jgi:hypothetical protein